MASDLKNQDGVQCSKSPFCEPQMPDPTSCSRSWNLHPHPSKQNIPVCIEQDQLHSQATWSPSLGRVSKSCSEPKSNNPEHVWSPLAQEPQFLRRQGPGRSLISWRPFVPRKAYASGSSTFGFAPGHRPWCLERPAV